ncbi:Hypothetical predicted protein [Pelobates cultripes]|uniref:Uncharacterized protein n=1 Tax=Pelobates cultripes TaxID=61616 RepID=A0AAD1SBX3_PELCU|nr:Hypothetical predicted protein [Pelobates cultripes]
MPFRYTPRQAKLKNKVRAFYAPNSRGLEYLLGREDVWNTGDELQQDSEDEKQEMGRRSQRSQQGTATIPALFQRQAPAKMAAEQGPDPPHKDTPPE